MRTIVLFVVALVSFQGVIAAQAETPAADLVAHMVVDASGSSEHVAWAYVYVSNDGAATASTTRGVLTLDGEPVFVADLPALAQGQWAFRSFRWVPTPGSHELRWTVDASEVVAETTEENNVALDLVSVDAPCASARCVVDLHVQPTGRALSSLPSDAPPADPAMRSTGGAFRAATAPLGRDVVLGTGDDITVHLAGQAEGRYVTGHVELTAVDLVGNVRPIGRVDYAAPFARAQDALAPFANTTLNQSETALPPAVAPAARGARQSAENAIGPVSEDPVFTALDLATDCDPPQSAATLPCRALNGDVGSGAFQPCAPEPDARSNLFAWATWYAVQTVEHGGTFRPTKPPVALQSWPVPSVETGLTPEEGVVCRDYNNTLIRPALAPAADAVSDANASDVPLRTPPADERVATAPEWRSLTFPIDAPLVLDSGVALVLDVRLAASPYPAGPFTPVQIEYAGSGFALRTHAAGLFDAFAQGRAPIAPGRHTGHPATPTDADDHTIAIGADETFEIVRVAGGGSYTLVSPSGIAQSLGSLLGRGPGWTLRVAPAGTSATAEYAFDVVHVGAPELDGGIVAGDGTYSGTLGPGDDADTWSFPAWQLQDIMLTLDVEGIDVQIVPSSVFDVHFDGDGDSQTVQAKADRTGLVDVTLRRASGAGRYALTVDLDASGALTGLPMVEPFWTGTRPVESLRGFGDGVDITFPFGTQAVHLGADGSVVPLGLEGPILGRTADGAVIARRDGAVSEIVLARDGSTEVAMHASSFLHGLASDGSVLFSRPGMLERRFADGTNVTMPLGWLPTEHVAAPDGRVLAMRDAGAQEPVWISTVDGIALEPAPSSLTGARAFDPLGRAYKILSLDVGDVIVRVDPATGDSTYVGLAEGQLRDMTFTDDALVVSYWEPELVASLGRLDVGIEGFTGFRPTYVLPDRAQLRPSGFEDEVRAVRAADGATGEEHVLRFFVTNDGAADAGPFNVEVTRQGRFDAPLNASERSWSSRVSGLGAGETVVLEHVWTGAFPGDQDLRVHVDPRRGLHDEVVETDEEDNVAFYTVSTFVSGVRT